MFTKADIEKYFNAEKSEALLFILIGLTAVLLALVFLFYLKTNWHKGVAIPFIIAGLVHLIIGFSVYKTCDKDRIQNVYAYDMDPASLQNREIPRMEKVKRNFLVYRYIEVSLLFCGLIIFFYFRGNPYKTFWGGLGLALAIEAAISLSFDFVAEKRAAVYTNGLRLFVGRLNNGVKY